MTKENLMNVLREKLSYNDYTQLPTNVGLTPTKISRMENGDTVLSFKQMKSLVLYLLEKEIYTDGLEVENFINYYGLGKDLTFTEINLLKEEIKRAV